MTRKTIPLLLLLCASFTGSAQTTFELNYGTGRLGVDVVYSTSLDSANRWMLLSRNIASYDRNHNTSFISFNSVAYTFKSGIGIANNTVYTTPRLYNALGLQYIVNRKDVFVYIYLTREASKANFYDHFVFVAWQPSITKNLRLVLQNELNTTLRDGKNEFTLERLKTGIRYRKVQVGLMVELVALSEGFQMDVDNVGFFLKKIL